MLKIQVLGKGMIPRGLGLAPRREFFKADLNLISTILMTPGLKVNMLNPKDGKIIPVTNSNLKRLWAQYRSDVYNIPSIVVEDEKNVKDEKDIVNSKVEEIDDIKPELNKENLTTVKPILVEEKEDVKESEKEENKEAVATVKPVMSDNKNNHNNNNHNKKK